MAYGTTRQPDFVHAPTQYAVTCAGSPQPSTAASADALNFRIQAMLLALFLSIFMVTAARAADGSGDFVSKQYSIKGGWSIVQNGNDTVIRLDKSFKTKGGPDLKLFLSPQSIDSVTGKTATEGAVLISPLTSNKGAQEYRLPAGIDLTDFESLLIHCESYSVLWGGTALPTAGS